MLLFSRADTAITRSICRADQHYAASYAVRPPAIDIFCRPLRRYAGVVGRLRLRVAVSLWGTRMRVGKQVVKSRVAWRLHLCPADNYAARTQRRGGACRDILKPLI